MSVNVSSCNQVGHQDDINNLKDGNEPHANDPYIIGGIGFICLSLAEGNAMFHITSSMLKLL